MLQGCIVLSSTLLLHLILLQVLRLGCYIAAMSHAWYSM
jgi:hypothetical protein